MSDSLCPICQRPNDSNAERCWYCQAVLPHENESKNSNNADWLNSFREDSTQSIEPVPSEPNPENIENDEKIPDWLAHIRLLEQLERESQTGEEVKNKSDETKDELPDWLKEIKAGMSDKKAEQEDNTESAALAGTSTQEAGISTVDSEQQRKNGTEEWLNHLAAWRPAKPPLTESKEKSSSFTENIPEDLKSDQENEASHYPIQLNPFAGTEDHKKNRGEFGSASGWQKLMPDEPVSGIEEIHRSEPGEESPTTLSEKPDEPNGDQQPGSSETGFDVNSIRSDLESEISPLDREINSGTDQIQPEETEGIQELKSIENRLFNFDQPPKETDEVDEPKPALIDDLPKNTPFLQDDLPDWLASASIVKTTKKTSEVVFEKLDHGVLDANLENTSLPAWLQAIRPVSNNIFADSETDAVQHTEEKGLLAGISGTLQSPEINNDCRKPVGYGSVLRVSERQKSNANLFASIMEVPLDEQNIAETKKSKKRSILWRLLLALVLISIILFTKDLLINITIQPALFPPEVVASYDVVNTITIDKPVLLVGDFEPATAGELSWSSQTFLENLIRRNLNFVILSTNPAGSAILSQYLDSVSQKIPGYDLSSHMIDLGYLPGGATGAHLLTTNIRIAKPRAVDLQNAWNSAILQPVNTLSDFGAMIVISDNAENARVWIEQVQPALTATPLLFVISAQAAPMLLPYFQSGQVAGYIAGVNGSLAYDKLFSQSSSASDHLSVYQASILFVALILLLGGLINLILPVVSERKR